MTICMRFLVGMLLIGGCVGEMDTEMTTQMQSTTDTNSVEKSVFNKIIESVLAIIIIAIVLVLLAVIGPDNILNFIFVITSILFGFGILMDLMGGRRDD